MLGNMHRPAVQKNSAIPTFPTTSFFHGDPGLVGNIAIFHGLGFVFNPLEILFFLRHKSVAKCSVHFPCVSWYVSILSTTSSVIALDFGHNDWPFTYRFVFYQLKLKICPHHKLFFM